MAETLSAKEDLLRAWVKEHGGHIDPALKLAESPTCNGLCAPALHWMQLQCATPLHVLHRPLREDLRRGWVAAHKVCSAEAATTPLIVMPRRLTLAPEDAAAALRWRLERAGSTAHLTVRPLTCRVLRHAGGFASMHFACVSGLCQACSQGWHAPSR